MRTSVKKLSWDPVRRGDVYCAPACGRRCTIQEYEAAVASGAALAKRLGRGWTSRVWENLGWHCNAVSPCGRLKVHGARGHYTAFLSERGDIGGLFSGQATTPHAAVAEAVEKAKGALEALTELVAGL